MLYPVSRPAVPQAPHLARDEVDRRAGVPDRPAPPLAPVAGAAREAPCGRGRLTVFPTIGYLHPDQSHFTSRHFWEVGALDAQADLRLARPADRRDRRRGERDAGPVARRLARPLARDAEEPGRNARRARPTTASAPTRCGTSPASCSRTRSARSARPPQPATRPSSPQARRRSSRTRSAATSAASSATTARRQLQHEGEVPRDRLRRPAPGARRAARRRLPDQHRRDHRARHLRHPLRPARCPQRRASGRSPTGSRPSRPTSSSVTWAAA